MEDTEDIKRPSADCRALFFSGILLDGLRRTNQLKAKLYISKANFKSFEAKYTRLSEWKKEEQRLGKRVDVYAQNEFSILFRKNLKKSTDNWGASSGGESLVTVNLAFNRVYSGTGASFTDQVYKLGDLLEGCEDTMDSMKETT